jgi:hypothetical protein
MVVLRSTTDCAAVSSRSSSARETVISKLPVGAATSGVMVAVDTVGLSLAANSLILGRASHFAHCEFQGASCAMPDTGKVWILVKVWGAKSTSKTP